MINKFGLKKRNYTVMKSNVIVIVLLLAIVSLGFGYATIQTTLNINGNIGLKSSIWDVYFDNVVIQEECSGVEGNSVSLSADLQTVNFTAKLNKQHNYFEFEVDTVNNGGIDAMIGDNVVVEGIADELEPYITIQTTFSDGMKIKPNYLLKAGESHRIKVRVDALDLKHLPSDGLLNLTLKLSYVQATSDAIEKLPSKNLNEVIKLNAISDTDINFGAISSDTNGKGVYLRNTTAGDENPIYYYRGEVYNNNLIYANHCWKLVRTTETGGVKIVYNGTVGENNTCPNKTGVATVLPITPFNTFTDDEKYVGYTYEENGKQIDSTSKEYLDKWYEDNIENDLKNYHYGQYLEDTVWCNDRSISSISGNIIYYGAYNRLTSTKSPSLTCSVVADSYTLKSTSMGYNSKLNGNELLDYPIAMLTVDEIMLAGGGFSSGNANRSFYLYNNAAFRSMSPTRFVSGGAAAVAGCADTGFIGMSDVNGNNYLRPAVSLASNTVVTNRGVGEEGTADNPYYVE